MDAYFIINILTILEVEESTNICQTHKVNIVREAMDQTLRGAHAVRAMQKYLQKKKVMSPGFKPAQFQCFSHLGSKPTNEHQAHAHSFPNK